MTKEEMRAAAAKLTFDRDMVREIVALMEMATEHEREACAKLCEGDVPSIDGHSRPDHDSHWGPRYAAAIRARSNS